MDKDILRFLDKIYKELYKSEDVLHYSKGDDTDKFGNLERYLIAQEEMHSKIIESSRHINLLKQLYYDRYVIKENDIPESIYQTEINMAFERGYGHITLNEMQKQEKRSIIINDQKRSLDIWLDYFLNDDSKVYPFWTKYWAFQGMLKIGKYDINTAKYTKRTKKTTAPFIELNEEALSISMDLVFRVLNKEQIKDMDLYFLVKSGSFAKIYTYIISKVMSRQESIPQSTQGIWVKYNQGSDHMSLVKSLQGYNTGWCTAGERTAKEQLSKGDFFVYYTLDTNGNYKVPRIAIRTEKEYIAEIRGIARNQNLEPEMVEVVKEKMKNFPYKDKYFKKIKDMELLSHIYKKYKNRQQLNVEELKFLYEVDCPISGFGHTQDPRIEEVKKGRNIIEDLNKVFSVYDSIKGDLDLWNLTYIKGLKLPKYIEGHLDLRNVIDLEDTVLPKSVGGYLYLWSISGGKKLVLPETVKNGVFLLSMTSYEDLVIPENLTYNIYLKGLDINPKNIYKYKNKIKK